MKQKNNLKRISFNVPIHLLKELDKLVKDDGETRTDFILNSVKDYVEMRKKHKNLYELHSIGSQY